MLRLRNYVTIMAVVMLLAGCAAGPDFKGGNGPQAQRYGADPLADRTAAAPVKLGGAQRFIIGGNLPHQWWLLYQSPRLDALIRQALKDSPTLAAAEATLRQAREEVNARTGSVNYPDVTLDAGTSRQKSSPAAFGQQGGKGSIYDLHHTTVGVSYFFDIFGKGRREIEALKARVEYERFQLEAAQLALSGNVVMTVIQEAAVRALIQATKGIILAQEKQLDLLTKQLALGSVSRSDVLNLQSELEATRAVLPAYDRELDRTRHQLTTLLGKLPGESASLPEFDLDAITLPADLPVFLPSELARQRPDIQAAEALLHAASAGVGVAAADLYPRISLSGSYGPQAGQWGDLFKADSLVWGVAAGISQPLLNGGSLRARKRGAIAVYDQAAAHFRETVIGAFQNVADALRALETDASVLKAQADAQGAAHEALMLVRQQFETGAVNYSLVLNAERQYQQSQIGLVQAQAARLQDTAALFQALGGGWLDKKQF